MVTRIGERATATFAGRDFRVAVPLEGASAVPSAGAGGASGSRIVDTLRWLARVWFEGWTMYVTAVRERFPERDA